jgi:hypothetical protein
MLGKRAGMKPGDLAYTRLMANAAMGDGTALFHADHSNLNTSKALTEANLKTAIAAFMKQTDSRGRPVGVMPKHLVVPPDLMLTAIELVKSATVIITGDTDTVRGAKNAIADLTIHVVAEARLSNSLYTGYSATTWYLAGDKSVVDTIEVAFLNGRQEPTLELFQSGADIMGVTWRVFHDCGAKPLDWRGMQKNTA